VTRQNAAAARFGLALAALGMAGCAREVATSAPPGTTNARPTVAPLPVGAASAAPAGVVALPEVARRADGERLVIVAHVWLRRPSCPPCPAGANCEPCPPPYWQLSEKPLEGMTSEPGAIVLADIPGDPDLDVKPAYVFEGALGTQAGQRVLVVDRIARLAAPPR